MVASAGWSIRDLKLRKWVLDHPGACKDVAARCRVSAEYVRLVLYGKRGGQKQQRAGKRAKVKVASTVKIREIIRLLKTRGAPL